MGRGAAMLLGATSGSWQTTFSQTLNARVYAGFATYMLIQRIDAALLSVSGSKVRITFEANTTDPWDIEHCYIGQRDTGGDAWDQLASPAPTRITFSGGSNGFSLSAGQTIRSDEITFAFDHTASHLISVDNGNTGTTAPRGIGTLAGAVTYTKVADGEATTQNRSGYGTGASALFGINKIEVFV